MTRWLTCASIPSPRLSLPHTLSAVFFVVTAWSSSVEERVLGGQVTGVVIICLLLKDIGEGNSIDDIVRRHNP